jgi:hypothetical protein
VSTIFRLDNSSLPETKISPKYTPTTRLENRSSNHSIQLLRASLNVTRQLQPVTPFISFQTASKIKKEHLFIHHPHVSPSYIPMAYFIFMNLLQSQSCSSKMVEAFGIWLGVPISCRIKKGPRTNPSSEMSSKYPKSRSLGIYFPCKLSSWTYAAVSANACKSINSSGFNSSQLSDVDSALMFPSD